MPKKRITLAMLKAKKTSRGRPKHCRMFYDTSKHRIIFDVGGKQISSKPINPGNKAAWSAWIKRCKAHARKFDVPPGVIIAVINAAAAIFLVWWKWYWANKLPRQYKSKAA